VTRFLAAAGPFTPFVVFLLAAAESAAFFGLVIPGEVAVILGGVAAGTGSVSLWVMIPTAVAGAVIGDSIGYRLGKTLGPSLLKGKRMARAARQLDKSVTMLAERGWWALVAARFASVLRAVVPFAAGMGKMPYKRFLLGNVVGGVAWGTTFTLVGYLAGANYPRVERWFRTGGLTVVGLVIVVGGIFWLTRWAQRNQGAVVRTLQRIAGTRPIQLLSKTANRLRLSGAALATTAVGIIIGMWLFGGLIQDVLKSEEFFFFDLSTIRYLAAHPIGWLVSVAKIVNAVTDARVVGLAVAVVALAAFFRRRRLAFALAASAVGQWIIVEVAEALVHRAPPAAAPLAPRIDYGFPSEQVALVAAVVVVAAWSWGRPDWVATVRRYGIAVVVVAITAAARVILIIDYPSDTIAAAGIAAAWSLIVCVLIGPRPAGQTPSRARDHLSGGPSSEN
jgi:undecaprenyl-diphosphatase